ncbi:hypothetical protein GRI68_09460 [Altererythrobacter halimionae]|uniref:Lipopolysaccharide biosynthesis protein n=2 Tax=Alteriqipengyuania halimionae TaxID=1926630 RepID=A0A6I4U7H4_9SPHN|nr:hypothetical protein [Alteriqipengyuania halimionae]
MDSTDPYYKPTPRWLLRVWTFVRDGMPAVGRYRRYIVTMAIPLAAIWIVTIAYLALVPDRFDSRMTLILPGSGVGGSVNLESIGQATVNSASAFSSTTLSPTENYKRLITSDIVLRDAAHRAGEDEDAFPAPQVKLIDQTNLIELTIPGASPEQARHRMKKVQVAFKAALDILREDEAATREKADANRIAELEQKVDAAQAALLQFQGETGLVSLDQFAGRVSGLDQMKAAERDRRVLVAESGGTAGRLASSLQITIPQARLAMQLKADPVFSQLLTRYAETVGEETQRGGTLGSAHGSMERLGAERTELRDALVRRGARLTGAANKDVLAFSDLAVSDTRERLFETLTNRDSMHAGNQAALAELRRQISQESGRSDELVAQASTLAGLVRDLRVAEAVFSSALARLDTNKADPFASYPLVQTLEAPSLPRGRSAPSPIIAVAGALGASIFVLFGFLLLWLRQPIIRKLLPNA